MLLDVVKCALLDTLVAEYATRPKVRISSYILLLHTFWFRLRRADYHLLKNQYF
jgi:hypothetical protein